MFKMNPAAKEFVPAYILKKREEEADLANRMDKVDINKSTNKENDETNIQARDDSTEDTKSVQQNENSKTISDSPRTSPKGNQSNVAQSGSQELVSHPADAKPDFKKQKESDKQHNHHNSNGTDHRNGTEYKDEGHNNHDLSGDTAEDERYLLNAGEKVCEFNGEQFIIPGDDNEYSENGQDGTLNYDFGNDEDNDNEDICNAFEEFLGALPNQ